METQFFYRGLASGELSMAGKRSLEWDPNVWKWNGDLFRATPINPNPLDSRSRQFFPLEAGNSMAGASPNSSSTCSDELSIGVDQGKHKRELDKKRRAVVTEDDNSEQEPANLALKLGGRGYNKKEVETFDRTAGKKTKVAGTNSNRAVCQVEDCGADLSKAKDYHRRHKVCEMHSKASRALVGNVMQRFCQQCSRFHALQEFDEGKRSCRRRLAGHNKRRRKTKAAPDTKSSSLNDNHASGYLLMSILKILSTLHYLRTTNLEYPSWTQQDSHQSSPPQTSGNSDSASAQSPSSSTGDAQSRTDRIVFKLFGKEPSDFPFGIRGQILDWLSHSPTDIESYIRPGCVILTIYLRMAESAWEELCCNLRSRLSRLLNVYDDTSFWRTGWIYVRVQNHIVFISNGHIVVDTSLPLIISNKSMILSVKPIAVPQSERAQFTVKGFNLSKPSTRLLCALEGNYLELESNGLGEDTCKLKGHDQHHCLKISCSVPELVGRGFIEVAIEAWKNTRDNTGFTPEDYARLRGHYSYIHLVQRKIQKKLASTGHVVVDVQSSFSSGSMKQKQDDVLITASFEIARSETGASFKQQPCRVCNKKLASGRRNSCLLYRPAMLSMMAIAAVCVCVALLFKSSPEVVYVCRPFRWEYLDYGSI